MKKLFRILIVMLHFLSDIKLVVNILNQFHHSYVTLFIIRALLDLNFIFRWAQEMNLVCLQLWKWSGRNQFGLHVSLLDMGSQGGSLVLIHLMLPHESRRDCWVVLNQHLSDLDSCSFCSDHAQLLLHTLLLNVHTLYLGDPVFDYFVST